MASSIKHELPPSLVPLTLEAGCDEAGCGCLAGPVYAAAVILPEGFTHPLLNDSKQLTEKRREAMRHIIETEAVAWAVASASAQEVDMYNVINASILAMHRALDGLMAQGVTPELIVVDGNRFKPYRDIPYTTIVKGDSKLGNIAAASILAKTHRDELMRQLALQCPGYGWEINKGYPTEAHRKAIMEIGLSQYHRLTFRSK